MIRNLKTVSVNSYYSLDGKLTSEFAGLLNKFLIDSLGEGVVK